MNADAAFRAAKHAVATLLAVLALGTLGVAAFAQDWPTRTVRIVVPFGPGSTPDVVARLVAEGLAQKYPASAFVVENKPGASGNLGTDIVAKATPDGSTLGVSIGGPLAINTLLFSRLPYDPRKDIEPITQLVTQPSVLAVNPGWIEASPHPHPVLEVLSGSKVWFEGRFVPDIRKIAVKSLKIAANVIATPGNGPLLRKHQPTQGSQEAGLPGAIVACDLQAFAGVHGKPDAPQHMPVAPPEVQILGLQASMGHVVAAGG